MHPNVFDFNTVVLDFQFSATWFLGDLTIKMVVSFQAPDMSSPEDFPTFGTGVTLKQASAWGPKKF